MLVGHNLARMADKFQKHNLRRNSSWIIEFAPAKCRKIK